MKSKDELIKKASEDYALNEDNIDLYRLSPAQIAEKAYLEGVKKGLELAKESHCRRKSAVNISGNDDEE